MYVYGLSKITNEIITLCVVIISSLIPEIIFLKSSDEERATTKTFFKSIVGCFWRFVIYFAAVCVSVLSFAIFRNWQLGTDIWSTFLDFLLYQLRHYFISMIFSPLIIRVIMCLLKMETRRCLVKCLLCAGLCGILCITPFFTNYGYSDRIPIENSILSQVKRIPFEFDSHLYDIQHLTEQIDKRYFLSDQISVVTDNDQSENGDFAQNADAETVDFANMSFAELLDYISDHMDDESGITALDMATEKYNRHTYDSSDDAGLARYYYFYATMKDDDTYYPKAISKCHLTQNAYMLGQAYRLWGYSIDNTEYLYKAIHYYKQEYRQEPSTLTALQIAYVYENLYTCYHEDTLKEALTYLNLTIENGDDYKEVCASTLLENYVRLYQSDKCTQYMDELNRSCALITDKPLLQILRILCNISENTYLASDVQALDDMLAQKGYGDCPKLLIMKAYLQYSMPNANTALFRGECEKALKVDMVKPDYFETEDYINLARLYYMDGEYIKAYQLAEKQQDNENVKDEAVLLMAESYLSAENAFSNLNDTKVYKTIKEVPLAESDESSTHLRIRIAKGILEYRLGIDKTLSGLSEACRKLFGDSNVNSEYIVAFLKYCDGKYQDCIAICDTILSEFDSNDYSKNQILFLKADALVGQAESCKSQDEKQDKYEEAEKALFEVYNSVESDYITSLEKLHTLYKQMPDRESELAKINDKLSALH